MSGRKTDCNQIKGEIFQTVQQFHGQSNGVRASAARKRPGGEEEEEREMGELGRDK